MWSVSFQYVLYFIPEGSNTADQKALCHIYLYTHSYTACSWSMQKDIVEWTNMQPSFLNTVSSRVHTGKEIWNNHIHFLHVTLNEYLMAEGKTTNNFWKSTEKYFK